MRGDVEESGLIDLADPISILQRLFLGGASICSFAADVDGSRLVDLSDAIYLLNYQFQGGSPPVLPFPECAPVPREEPDDCTGEGCR